LIDSHVNSHHTRAIPPRAAIFTIEAEIIVIKKRETFN